MADVTWADAAAADFEEIYRYLMRSGRAAAELFRDSLLQAAEQLSSFPRSGRMVPEMERDDLRQLVLMNYRLIYRLFDDEVEIDAIFHGARRFYPSSLP